MQVKMKKVKNQIITKLMHRGKAKVICQLIMQVIIMEKKYPKKKIMLKA